MRWDNLTVGEEEERRLAGYKDPAVVRRFDAPEALDVRFYEVHARSVLNRVPEKSRMPFRWTINPYRGCTHACSYCIGPDTPILMADGRPKPIADVRAGDLIYGTTRHGWYRAYALTRVLAHWSTVKEAFRITLDDGTELVTSGDHRFLSERGWKHVTGAGSGPGQRPHLTTNNWLKGTGRFADAPEDSPDYRRGYLCGLIRGDGSIGSYSYARAGRRDATVHRFRLALIDLEALIRAREYLAEVGIATNRRQFQAATRRTKEVVAIATASRDGVAGVVDLIAWPRWPSLGWAKGFLAGIFDAEGHCHEGIFRIANTDDEIIDRTAWCLRRLGFDFVIEDRGQPNRPKCVRLRGGLREQLRFFHSVDPVITRKRHIAERTIKSNGRLRVVGIEPLGVEREMYDITTGTGDFIANGVVSHNCFARPTHKYLGMNAGRDFEREIVVKVNAPEVARAQMSRPSWKHEHVAMGTNTDPYQWVEGRYKLMPGIWEAMRDTATPCSILTKSPLLLRDLSLLQEVGERAPVSANLSVPTLDEKAWRATEPHTPHPRARLEAVAELNRAGIPTGVLVAPLMPGINDSPEQVERILELAAEAGAVSAGGIALHLRGEVREIFFDWLRSHRPDLIPRYEQLYRRGAYAPPGERQRMQELLRGAWEVAGAARPDPGPPTRHMRGGLPGHEPEAPPEPPEPPAQAALF